MKNPYLARCIALFSCMIACISANATNIQVRQECGFSFAECGPLFNLTKNGGAANYQFDENGQPIFSIAYIGNDFVMTALVPNTIASEGTLPYGLDIYLGGGPLIQKWDCFPSSAPECQGGTAIAFVSWMNFPTDPNLAMVVHVSSVPEMQPGVLAFYGVGIFLLNSRRKRLAL